MTEPDPMAQAAMVAYCGWDPTNPVTGATVLLDGNGTRLLALPSLYVTAVSAVSVTDAWGTVTARTVGPGMDVGWSVNGCLTWNGWDFGAWPIGQGNIAVTYSGGYNGAPDDLEAALASVSARTSSATFGATTRRMGTASVAYGLEVSSGDFLMVERMVFDRYRLPRVA